MNIFLPQKKRSRPGAKRRCYAARQHGKGTSQVPPPEAVACFMRLEAAENKKARQCLDEPMCSTARGSGF